MNRTAAAILALSLAPLAACSARADKASLPALPATASRAVRVAHPATRIETGLARATGTIRAREDAVLSAKGTGQIRRILVGVGDRVRAGAPLVEMDPVNAQIALQNARAAERLAQAGLASAEQDLARGKSLFEQGSMPQAAWEKAQTGRELAAAQLDQARAAVRAGEQAVADSTLTAPFAGVITAKFRNAGDTVTLMPVSPILALTDVEHLEARLALPEAIESFARPGQVVQGVITPSGQRFEAKVRVKNAVVDPGSRTVEVLADVTKVTGSAPRPGSLVTVDFGGFAERDGLFVPASAVRTEGDASYLFVVTGGKADRRKVEVTPVHPGTVAVRSGLEAGAEVVQDPGTLAVGDTVVPLPN
jgi:RND family efflux transporter MFP subunit